MAVRSRLAASARAGGMAAGLVDGISFAVPRDQKIGNKAGNKAGDIGARNSLKFLAINGYFRVGAESLRSLQYFQ